MTPYGSDMMPFTIAQFVLIGVFALLAIAAILYGMKLKRRRTTAQEEIEEHREAADAQRVAPPAAVPEATVAPPAEAAPLAEPAPFASQPPVAPMPPPLGDQAVVAAPAAAPAPLASNIMQLKGLGPKLAATLAGLGITRVEQIAAMSPAELDTLDAQLGTFRGRPARDRWAEQARLLVAGDKTGYEAAFGKLG
jgi:predicted flap endonuclease-1-like 5' DNA nuclease